MALLFAGHETTVVQIGLTAMLLLANPGQWQALVDKPSLVPNAVEETLRVLAETATSDRAQHVEEYERAWDTGKV